MKKIVLMLAFAFIFVQTSFFFTERVYAETLESTAADIYIEPEPEEVEEEPYEPPSKEEQALCEAACKAEVPPTLVDLGYFKATAYCPCTECCGENACGLTSSGTVPRQGSTIAVDTSVIPRGSTVVVEYPDGHRNTYKAEDTGGAIQSNRIDIYFDSHQDALDFGVKQVKVYLEV